MPYDPLKRSIQKRLRGTDRRDKVADACASRSAALAHSLRCACEAWARVKLRRPKRAVTVSALRRVQVRRSHE
jgi:hypothetical protein